ncbi:hypothetical protein GCM10022409_34490 [Hymenobacter glaciei]|uniref:Uncharacterized protein n=1 Tax=Hymenobacter glaciei TaxID=877209 RepID=A0ABP7UK87_9BACT
MNKRKLTRRQELQNLLQEAESDSILVAELEAVQVCLNKPKHKAVGALLRMLCPSLRRTTKWFITKVLESIKDERIIRPMMRAAQAPENAEVRSYFLWPLIKYDCTKHLAYFVNFIVKIEDPGEAMMICIMIIRAMKGPFEPELARKSIRKLLAETKRPADMEMKVQTEAFRLEAADFIMAKYFNATRRTFWLERNGSVPISKTS